LTFTYN